MDKITWTDQTLAYTWRQLAQRVGIVGQNLADDGFEHLGITVYYDRPDSLFFNRPAIVVVPCSDDAWHKLLNCKSLDCIQVQDALPPGSRLSLDDPIPVVFWGKGYQDGGKPFVEQDQAGVLVFYADIIATTFFMLSRWEEAVVDTRDEHRRFPATASVAYKQGFLDRPIVDEYALILREWLKVLLPGWTPKPRSFSVKLSHDVDVVRRFSNWQAVVRTLGGDLIKRHRLGLAWQTGMEAIAQVRAPEQTPQFQGLGYLAALSLKYGLGDDAFYFMATERGPFDDGYDPGQLLIRRCIQDLCERGFEVGFHAGYETFNDPDLLAAEKARLDAVLGQSRYGGRQHYLRFQTPDTWRYWDKVGLSYDSTVGYADHEGFRCGTCHPFHPFDLEQNCELDLWEEPLIVMDGTLRDYRGLSPEQSEVCILELARRCKQVEGMFTLLWHNSSLHGGWLSWKPMYARVVRALAEMRS